jgi:hypothetical protein
MSEQSLSEVVSAFEAELEESRRINAETLDKLDAIMDRGWKSIFGDAFDEREGPTLLQIKEASKRNREMSLNPHVGGGLELIHSYVWGDGVHYELGLPKGPRRAGRPTATAAAGAAIRDAIESDICQTNYFGMLARKERQAAAYYDGMIFVCGDDTGGTKLPYQISLQSITEDYRNPERDEEIWAYRRTWYQYKPGTNEQDREVKSEWIFVNEHYDKIGTKKYIRYMNHNEPINKNKRLFVKKVNPMVGWSYGIADVQRGISWADDYRIAMLDGKKMNSSMASIWAQAKAASVAGAKDAAAKMGNVAGGGNVVHNGAANALTVLPSAGNAYDFEKLLPLLAMFAAGIGVSVVALSMNSGNAGGSYGAAKTLERPEQLSTRVRRTYQAELDRAVLLWMGADKDVLDVWFDPIIDPTERYRAEQTVDQRMGTGLYDGLEIKRMHAQIDGRDPEKVTPVPEGWMIPNNENTIEAEAKIAADNAPPPAAGANPANGGKFTPTQGSGQGQGQGDQKSDDIRTNREAMIEHLVLELDISAPEAEMIVDGLVKSQGA